MNWNGVIVTSMRYPTMTLILFQNLLFPSLVFVVSRDAPSLLLVVSRDTCPESTFGSATQTITKVKSDNPEKIETLVA